MLGLAPSKVYTMSPLDVWALIIGGQRKWNKVCELVAWQTWLMMGAWVKNTPRTFAKFMEEYPPPGWSKL